MHTQKARHGKQLGTIGLLGLLLILAAHAGAQALYVPSQITDLKGGQNLKSTGPIDRPGYFGMQNLAPGQFTAGTTATCGNYRIGHGIFTNVTGLRLLYTNATFNPGFNPALAGSATITVRAAVEIGGTTYPVFFNGSRNVNIDYGGYVVSDPLSINLNAAAVNNLVFSRTEVTVASAGLLWPLFGYATNVGSNSLHVTAAATDLTLGTGILDNVNVSGGSTNVYGPSAILARKSGGVYSPAVAIVGDSIAAQADDSQQAAMTCGWPERAVLGAGLGSIKVAIGSDGLPVWNQDSVHSMRGSLIENCGYCIDEMGVNDLGAGNFALQQANNIKNWTWLVGMGMKVYKSTITPNTTSTDQYATASNQTVSQPSVLGGSAALFVTGTVASTPSVGGSTLSATVATAAATNGYAGYSLLMTSGAAKGVGFNITSNTSGTSPVLTLVVTTAHWTSLLPAPGDTFEIAANRIAENDWFRQLPPPLSGVIEAADAVECNNIGVQTRNGGYWWPKPIALYTGMVTSFNGANATLYNLGDFTFGAGSTTISPLYGYQGEIITTASSVLTWTSGTQAGRSSSVPGTGFSAGIGFISLIIAQGMVGGASSPYTAAPANGDTYTLSNCIQVYGDSGPHPSRAGHEAIALAAQAVLSTFK